MRNLDEIDFNRLSSTRFEELCFDLLAELGFTRLVWRRGGADSGRDIQGVRTVSAGITDPFEETWFFECKRVQNGVSPEEMNAKIAWADAERPKHLVFLISSYVTNNGRTWLERLAGDKFYRIHLVEGKQLQQLLLRSEALLSRYFSSDVQQLMQQAHRAWVHHNLIPEPWLLRTLADVENLHDYTPAQLAFLWSTLKRRFQDLNANMADSWGESYDIMFGMLKQHANSSGPVISKATEWSLLDEQEGVTDWDIVYRKVYTAEVAYLSEKVEYLVLYSVVRDSEGEGIEVLVTQDSNLTYRIRHLPTQAREAVRNARLIFGTLDRHS